MSSASSGIRSHATAQRGSDASKPPWRQRAAAALEASTVSLSASSSRESSPIINSTAVRTVATA
jgi:hypothetical protein